MQILGTEAIRTRIQPLNPKRETTKITNSKNTKRIYGQPSEQLNSIKFVLRSSAYLWKSI